MWFQGATSSMHGPRAGGGSAPPHRQSSPEMLGTVLGSKEGGGQAAQALPFALRGACTEKAAGQEEAKASSLRPTQSGPGLCHTGHPSGQKRGAVSCQGTSGWVSRTQHSGWQIPEGKKGGQRGGGRWSVWGKKALCSCGHRTWVQVDGYKQRFLKTPGASD